MINDGKMHKSIEAAGPLVIGSIPLPAVCQQQRV